MIKKSALVVYRLKESKENVIVSKEEAIMQIKNAEAFIEEVTNAVSMI